MKNYKLYPTSLASMALERESIQIEYLLYHESWLSMLDECEHIASKQAEEDLEVVLRVSRGRMLGRNRVDFLRN